MTPSAVALAITRAKVVAIVRLERAESVVAAVRALVLGGIRAVEITLTTPRAIELIAELHAEFGSEVLLGAGTVLAVESVQPIAAAGGSFVVSPIFKRELITAAHAQNMAALPGCFSPTEIVDAWTAGADIVKVFPATALGPTFLKDLRGPFPELKLLPTGGVDLQNAAQWLRAGACAIGVGGALVDRTLIDSGQFHVLSERARALVASLASQTTP